MAVFEMLDGISGGDCRRPRRPGVPLAHEGHQLCPCRAPAGGVFRGGGSVRPLGLATLGILLLLAYVVGSATDGASALWRAAKTAGSGVWQSFEPLPRERGFRLGAYVDVAAGDAAAHRVRLLAPALAAPVVITGGRYRFMDRCPGFVGCVAVEYDRRGRFVHGYPFRPEAYEAALVPHGLAQPPGFEWGLSFDFAKHSEVTSVVSYPNGDLAVMFASWFVMPSALGIARIDRDGRPRWFRADGSHHWATLAAGRLRGVGAGQADVVVVPGRRMGVGWPPHRSLGPEAEFGRAKCSRHFVESLNVIDGDGVLLRQVAIAETLRGSPHAPMLAYSRNACSAIHLNSVAVLAAHGPFGLAGGDFLVSLRDIGALAAFDGADGRLKRVWRGSFYGQHGARELARPGGPAFLLFDNWGREGEYGPGRLVALNPQTGRERTIFPNASTPATVRMSTENGGGVSVAPDGSRAIVHAYKAGQAVEVDLATGEVTAVFEVLDDVSAVAGVAGPADRAFRWPMMDAGYVASG